ncbi:histidine phosphatase family protein [Paenibacillus sp. 2RAB27]|uniref:histidine phosphatase family protein n=1 Tax=Paenibacillus sp. 2RAB27 TaxID=3232991 RepID=UPI003F9BFC0A
MKNQLLRLLSIMMVAIFVITTSATASGQNVDNKKQEDKTLTLYFVRHGETLFNKQKRMQGFSDSPLTEEGIEVAENLGRGMKDIPFTAAYSSTSERALDTADLILKGRNIPLKTDKRLKEMYFGNWEGEYTSDLLKQHPDMYTNQNIFKSVGGETQAELLARTKEAVNQIVEENKLTGGNVLVVSHGLTILTYILGLDPTSWDMSKGGLPNSSVTTVQWKDGKFTVQKVGDQSYAEKGEQKLTLYLVRHGETLFNKQGRMQGYSDSSLTEEGIKVAENLGKGLRDVPFIAAYSSTSERASDTADLILKDRYVPYKEDKRLKEMNFGNWEGEYTKDILKLHPDLNTNFDLVKSLAGGESQAELVERASAAINRIIEENKSASGNVLIVSHGITILKYILALDPKSFDISKGGLPNSSVTTVEWKNGKFKVLKVGDQSYAEKGQKMNK